MSIEYTLVVGVDRVHFRQLKLVWPTWRRFKPSLLEVPMVVFYDRFQVQESHIVEVIDHPNLTCVPWPSFGVSYEGDPDDKWTNPQRYRMLAGFVYVPAMVVTTPYWLKIDTDVVATGVDDWINPEWFQGHPAIVSHRWGFTKPPYQMIWLDEWVERHKAKLNMLAREEPLNLFPEPGRDRVEHSRIISWCGFFSTVMTRTAATAARETCGEGLLPVPSQDGFLWYVATRMQYSVVRTFMKGRGFEWRSNEKAIREIVEKVMN